MSMPFAIWTALLVLVALIWLSRHWAIRQAHRQGQSLSEKHFTEQLTNPPRVSILVAAKDEQRNIEACVVSLLQQDYPNYEVIAINDRSADQTPAILDRLAHQHPGRLKVLHVHELREGWFGKNNAMREGIANADGTWFCFTDADCRQISTKSLSVAMHYAVTNEIDFLSILPVLETKSFWERVIQPVCAAIMAIWFNPHKVNDRNSSASYANGAFMLMQRENYEHIGGHDRVKTEVNEDMHMARLTKESGKRLFVIQNDDLYRTHMYANFKESWRGWSRIFYGCFGTFRRLFISTLVLCFASLFPLVSLLMGLAGVLLADPPTPAWSTITWLSALTLLIQHSVLFRFYGLTKTDRKLVPTYLVGAFIALGMLLNAMMKVWGKSRITWRGTSYQGKKLAR